MYGLPTNPTTKSTVPTTTTTSTIKFFPSDAAGKATATATTSTNFIDENQNRLRAGDMSVTSHKKAARTPESHLSVLQVNEYFETMWKKTARTPESPSSILEGNEHFDEKMWTETRDPNGLPCLDQRVLELLESGMDLRPVETVFTEPDQFDQAHPIETPELVAFKLQEFDRSVAKTSSKEAAEAERRCPELLTPQFKLLFLRTECFRIKVSFLM